jgi:hypothetical protein
MLKVVLHPRIRVCLRLRSGQTGSLVRHFRPFALYFRLSAVACPDYEVTDPLPNVTWTMPRSFAGSVSVNRTNHPNNTLFFYAFEREGGSLTAASGERTDEPWVIWLNGGWVAGLKNMSRRLNSWAALDHRACTVSFKRSELLRFPPDTDLNEHVVTRSAPCESASTTNFQKIHGAGTGLPISSLSISLLALVSAPRMLWVLSQMRTRWAETL